MATVTARLYYEAHITVSMPKPPEDEIAKLPAIEQSSARSHWLGQQWSQFSTAARMRDWKASRFDIDEVDSYDGAWFLSARDTDRAKIAERILTMIQKLDFLDYEVIRWKIEDTVVDSKHGDEVLALQELAAGL